MKPVVPASGGNDVVPGRTCPLDYVYEPAVFDREAEIEGDPLYVIGGLYGNLQAFAAIERLALAERTRPTLVFNGDFHWFDADPAWFREIEHAIAPHAALRGNIETEITRDSDIGAGCGCAYPPSVDEGTVRHSNQIIDTLRMITPATARTRLARLPMHLVARIGGLRVGIVHGDAASLAGWRFAHDALNHPQSLEWLNEVRHASRIDLFASTHTCLAALRDFELPAGRLTIFNNGSAGMPNFSGSRCGVITRIAATPSPHRPLYGLKRDGIHIDAIAVDYDHCTFLKRFLSRWPQGSCAHTSYFRRITSGPEYAAKTAAG